MAEYQSRARGRPLMSIDIPSPRLPDGTLASAFREPFPEESFHDRQMRSNAFYQQQYWDKHGHPKEHRPARERAMQTNNTNRYSDNEMSSRYRSRSRMPEALCDDGMFTEYRSRSQHREEGVDSSHRSRSHQGGVVMPSNERPCSHHRDEVMATDHRSRNHHRGVVMPSGHCSRSRHRGDEMSSGHPSHSQKSDRNCPSQSKRSKEIPLYDENGNIYFEPTDRQAIETRHGAHVKGIMNLPDEDPDPRKCNIVRHDLRTAQEQTAEARKTEEKARKAEEKARKSGEKARKSTEKAREDEEKANKLDRIPSLKSPKKFVAGVFNLFSKPDAPPLPDNVPVKASKLLVSPVVPKKHRYFGNKVERSDTSKSLPKSSSSRSSSEKGLFGGHKVETSDPSKSLPKKASSRSSSEKGLFGSLPSRFPSWKRQSPTEDIPDVPKIPEHFLRSEQPHTSDVASTHPDRPQTSYATLKTQAQAKLKMATQKALPALPARSSSMTLERDGGDVAQETIPTQKPAPPIPPRHPARYDSLGKVPDTTHPPAPAIPAKDPARIVAREKMLALISRHRTQEQSRSPLSDTAPEVHPPQAPALRPLLNTQARVVSRYADVDEGTRTHYSNPEDQNDIENTPPALRWSEGEVKVEKRKFGRETSTSFALPPTFYSPSNYSLKSLDRVTGNSPSKNIDQGRYILGTPSKVPVPVLSSPLSPQRHNRLTSQGTIFMTFQGSAKEITPENMFFPKHAAGEPVKRVVELLQPAEPKSLLHHTPTLQMLEGFSAQPTPKVVGVQNLLAADFEGEGNSGEIREARQGSDVTRHEKVIRRRPGSLDMKTSSRSTSSSTINHHNHQPDHQPDPQHHFGAFHPHHPSALPVPLQIHRADAIMPGVNRNDHLAFRAGAANGSSGQHRAHVLTPINHDDHPALRAGAANGSSDQHRAHTMAPVNHDDRPALRADAANRSPRQHPAHSLAPVNGRNSTSTASQNGSIMDAYHSPPLEQQDFSSPLGSPTHDPPSDSETLPDGSHLVTHFAVVNHHLDTATYNLHTAISGARDAVIAHNNAKNAQLANELGARLADLTVELRRMNALMEQHLAKRSA